MSFTRYKDGKDIVYLDAKSLSDLLIKKEIVVEDIIIKLGDD